MFLLPLLRYELCESRGFSVLFTVVSPLPCTVLGTEQAPTSHCCMNEMGPRPDPTFYEEEKGYLSSSTPSYQSPAAHTVSQIQEGLSMLSNELSLLSLSSVWHRPPQFLVQDSLKLAEPQ